MKTFKEFLKESNISLNENISSHTESLGKFLRKLAINYSIKKLIMETVFTLETDPVISIVIDGQSMVIKDKNKKELLYINGFDTSKLQKYFEKHNIG